MFAISGADGYVRVFSLSETAWFDALQNIYWLLMKIFQYYFLGNFINIDNSKYLLKAG